MPKHFESLKYLVLMAILTAAMFHVARPQSSEVDVSPRIWRGIVRLASGQPVEGVLVSGPPSFISGVKTKADGTFEISIPRHIETVFFWHRDYQPYSMRLDYLKEEPFEVVIQRSGDEAWNIPKCSEVSNPELYVGYGMQLRVRVPAGMKLRFGSHFGMLFYHIRFGPTGGSGEWLQLVKTAESIDERNLLGGTSNFRLLRSGTVIGIVRQYQGSKSVVMSDGKTYITFPVQIKEAEKAFNEIVDTVCHEPNPNRSYSKNTGRIQGRKYITGKGWIPGGAIELEPNNLLRAQPYNYETYADGKGRFDFNDLPAGIYTLTTSDLRRKYKRLIRVSGGRTSHLALKVVPVTNKDIDDIQRRIGDMFPGDCPDC